MADRMETVEAREFAQQAAWIAADASRLPQGTPAAKERRENLLRFAGNVERLAKALDEAKVAKRRAGVVKSLSAWGYKHLSDALARAIASVDAGRAAIAKAQPWAVSSELAWKASEMMQASQVARLLTASMEGLEDPQRPDYGLAEAVADMAKNLERWSPCESTSPGHRMEGQAHYAAAKDALEVWQRVASIEEHEAEQAAKGLPAGTL